MTAAPGKLSPANFEKGFLIDETWMASVSKSSDGPGYAAFIIDHTEGETLAFRTFENLDQALAWVNAIPRKWTYETTSGCGDGGCSGEKCGPSKCKKEACSIYVPPAP